MVKKTDTNVANSDEDRWRFVSDLQKNGSTAVDRLINNLRDPDHRVRIAAADALGSIQDTRAYDHLIRLLSDPEHDVRFAVAIALGKLGDQRAVGPLEGACRDTNCFVRLAAQESLTRLLPVKLSMQ